MTLRLRALLILFIASYASCCFSDTLELPKGIIALDGRQAPALILNNMDGEPFDLQKHRGGWVVVHFWASWCGPCRREMPTINEIYKQFDEAKLRFVLINTAESDDTVFSFIGIAAPDMIPLMDKDGEVTELWQPRGLPASFFVDPTGRLRYLALGGRDWRKPEYIRFLKYLAEHLKP